MSEGVPNIEADVVGENVTLSYARVVPEIRYRRLALGAAFCVLRLVLGMAERLVFRMESLSFQARDWITVGIEWLGFVCVLCAVLLIGRAMPAVRPGFRWKFAACLIVAGLEVLFLLGVAAWAVGSEYWHMLPEFSIEGSLSIGVTLNFLQGVIVLMGAWALVAISARAGKGRLGILGAAVHVGIFTAVVARAGITAWEIKDGFWRVHEKIPIFVEWLLDDLGFWGAIVVAVVWGIVAIAAGVVARRERVRGLNVV